MREYELTVLIHPDLEADVEPALKKVRDIVTANKGSIKKEDNWGKKRLQYKIGGEEFAVYVYFEIELPASANAKVQSTLNITDEVLRYLLVSVDEKVRALQAEEAKEDKEEE
ncbi:MAG TPA: 30S ribosomal protein S6 [Candidatus Saccharibacteria bacterium]|nr:30S ribosomal protein S6 [Candidatus Saccharibacteria bacterium]